MAKDFTLHDYRRALEHLGRSIRCPLFGGTLSLRGPGVAVAEKARRTAAGVIDAMTEEERRAPGRFDASRRRRIARGSGTDPLTVQEILCGFERLRAEISKSRQLTMWQRFKTALRSNRTG